MMVLSTKVEWAVVLKVPEPFENSTIDPFVFEHLFRYFYDSYT